MASVLLSSHLLGDLERLCDYLVVIANGQVQVAGDIETLISDHHLLVGPRFEGDSFLSGANVLKAVHTDRQSSVWVRGSVPILPTGWRQDPLPLEELVILYLATPAAVTLPAPELQSLQR